MGQGPPGAMGVGIFIAKGMGAENNLYGTGGALEYSWHFMPGRKMEGRLRTGLFALGAGSKMGRFGLSYNAHSEGLSVGWDFLFVPEGRAVIPFLGLGGALFRYSYQNVPDNVTMVDPINLPVRSESENTAALGASAGLIVPLGTRVEFELRYTILKHAGVALLGPAGEAFFGDYFNPSPSHLAFGVRWRF